MKSFMASKNESNDWVAHQLRSLPNAAPGVLGERREERDRRHRVWWSVFYGSFNPRRRRPPRRLDDSRYHSVDWHASHLLAVAISILLLSVCDACLTLALLEIGAREANPLMACLLDRGVMPFLVGKYVLTAAGLPILLLFQNFKLFGTRFRVFYLLPALVALYIILLVYQLSLLQTHVGL